MLIPSLRRLKPYSFNGTLIIVSSCFFLNESWPTYIINFFSNNVPQQSGTASKSSVFEKQFWYIFRIENWPHAGSVEIVIAPLCKLNNNVFKETASSIKPSAVFVASNCPVPENSKRKKNYWDMLIPVKKKIERYLNY